MTLNETFIIALLFVLRITLFAFEEMEHNIHVFEKRSKRLRQQHPRNA